MLLLRRARDKILRFRACTVRFTRVTHVLASLEALACQFCQSCFRPARPGGACYSSPFCALPSICISLHFYRNGILEYWGAQSCGRPPTGAVTFKFKTDTDLYDLAKAKTKPCSISFSPDGRSMATTSRDKQVSCACGSVGAQDSRVACLCRGESP